MGLVPTRRQPTGKALAYLFAPRRLEKRSPNIGGRLYYREDGFVRLEASFTGKTAFTVAEKKPYANQAGFLDFA